MVGIVRMLISVSICGRIQANGKILPSRASEKMGQKECMKWIQNLLELGKSFNVIHCLHIICTVLLRVNRCVVAG